MKRKLKDLPKDAPNRETILRILRENPTLECLLYKIAKLERELELKNI